MGSRQLAMMTETKTSGSNGQPLFPFKAFDPVGNLRGLDCDSHGHVVPATGKLPDQTGENTYSFS